MDIDTAFIISGVMCVPFLTFILYFFDDKKPEGEGWKGFFKWLISFRFLDIFLGGGKKSDGGNAGMKSILIACCLSLFCGCATINNRILGNNTITETYQCTSEGIAWCTFVTFPQIIAAKQLEFQWANIVSVPIGVCCFIVDIPIEFVCDTICWPYDKYMTTKYYKAVDPLAK